MLYLTRYRIQDVENQIAAGLIEEVIEVAEGEYKLIDTLAESKVLVFPPSVLWASERT